MTSSESSSNPDATPIRIENVGSLSKVVLVASDGARAEVYLHGAHVTSWLPAGETADRLFLSSTSRFSAGAAIRGGVPVCFPQFAGQGSLPSHGFARVSTWSLMTAEQQASGVARATLALVDSENTRTVWPHAFRLELTVTVAGRKLEMNLVVANTDKTAFEFTGALHTYLRVVDIRQAVLAGLQNVRYRDKVLGTDDVIERSPMLHIDREIDRIYYAAPDLLEVREPDRTTAVRATGFADTVVWNPAERGAALSDLEAGGYMRMLCVEAASARAPIKVDAGERWMGSQILTAR